ncbi:MAG: hypothetical protein AB1445_08740 [Bacillota bacterium]
MAGRGYVRPDGIEYLKWQCIGGRLPGADLPPGFSVSPLAEGMDISSRHACAGKAFGAQPLSGEIYRVTQSAPSYRADLDLGVIDDGGNVCAVSTVWLDRSNSLGYFEPVATHPGYQRRCLGKAFLVEGLRRLQELGASMAYVEAYGDERSAFYASAGFTDYVAFHH